MSTDVDMSTLWEELRSGDRSAATRIIKHLIQEGDDASLKIASDAIVRHFMREVVDLIESSRNAPAVDRVRIVDRAMEALASASLAQSLPELLGRDGAMAAEIAIPGLAGSGIVGGILLTWTSLPTNIFGIEATVYDQTGKAVASSGIITPPLTQTQFLNLTDGSDYIVAVTTLSDLPSSVTQLPVRAGLLNTSLPAVGALSVSGAQNGLNATWTLPSFAGYTLQGLVLSVEGLGTVQTMHLPATATAQQITSLVEGSPYRVVMQPVFTTIVASTTALGVQSAVTQIAGLSGTPFTPRFKQLPADPLFFLDSSLDGAVTDAERLLTTAGRIGAKFTYDYLKAQAEKAAADSLSYDNQILGLMSMTLSKAGIAASEFTPVLISAIAQLAGDTQEIGDVASATPVTDAINTLGQDMAKWALFAAILIWLASTDAFQVWISFFEALIADICSFDTSFSHVKSFFEGQYATLNATLKQLMQKELDGANGEIDSVVAPIKSAVAGIIGSTSTQMGRIFASFDLPLAMGQTSNSQVGNVLVPNANPLTADLKALQKAVSELAEQLKGELRVAVSDVMQGDGESLFIDLLIAYFVVPIVVALAVAIAGGPIAAAILAVIIAVSAEELLHLIAGWLTGPLNDELAKLAAIVQNDILTLGNAIRAQIPLSSLMNPTSVLNLAEDQLRELATLLPQAFLEDVANLLGQVRNERLQSAILHALAAEQALGTENGTAFDRIKYAYQSALSAASQLPGSSDSSFLSAARLLADLGKVEEDLAAVTDGKEIQITRRLSLFQLLGGQGDPVQAGASALNISQFASFLQSGRAAISIDPQTLLDDSFPGAYRALITDLSVTALSKLPTLSNELLGTALSVSLTQTGESWARVKRDANRLAPPISMPDGFPDRTAFALAASYRNLAPIPMLSPNSLEGKIWSIITGMNADMTWDNVRRACLALLPQAIADLGNVVYLGRIAATSNNEDTANGHQAFYVLEDNRATYYSSQLSASPTPTTPVTLTIQLGQQSEVITGLRMWPMAGNAGFPGLANLSFAVSDTGAPGTFRTIPSAYIASQSITTAGSEAVYVHFPPCAGQYVQIAATQLGAVGAQYAFQLCSVQVESMNVTATPIGVANAYSPPPLVDPNNPVANLINGQTNTYYSSITYSSTNPGSNFPWFTVDVPSDVALTRIRLNPWQGGIFPSALRFELRGVDTFPFDFPTYAVNGTGPQDFYFPTYTTAQIFMRATILPSIGANQYALQLQQLFATSYRYRPSIITGDTIAAAVTAVINAMNWPPQQNIDPVQAAVAIAGALSSGVSGISDLFTVAGSMWDGAWSSWLRRVAKWNGARMVDEPDPNVRALNYVRLVRPSDPETITFDLFPTQSSPSQNGILLEPLQRDVFTDSRQYTPLQNLGLGGVLEINAPKAAEVALADLILQVTVRACYSEELAAAVTAGVAQQRQQIGRANLVGNAAGRILSLGQPSNQIGTSPIRTVKFSLRTQRDRVFQSALAAAQVQQNTTQPIGNVTVDNLLFTPSNTNPLSLGAPFSFFGQNASGGAPAPISGLITLSFTKSTASTLVSQLNTFAVTPGTLGIDDSILQSALLPVLDAPTPQVVGLSVIFIPMRSPTGAFSATAGATSSALNNLLGSGWTPNAPIPGLITMTPPNTPNPINIANLWPSTNPLSLSFDVSQAIANGTLYDVIVSVSYSTPVLTSLTTSGAFSFAGL